MNDREPPHDCPLCPRLAAFRADERAKLSRLFQRAGAELRAARRAPADRGPGAGAARRQPHRPALHRRLGRRSALRHPCSSTGWRSGTYRERADDGLELVDCAIANAVRCVPPQNKPTPAEIKTCRQFLTAQLRPCRICTRSWRSARSRMTASATRWARRNPRILSRHGGSYEIGKLRLISSYHCSRYNTNTGVLTEAMFDAVVKQAKIAAMPQL